MQGVSDNARVIIQNRFKLADIGDESLMCNNAKDKGKILSSSSSSSSEQVRLDNSGVSRGG